LPQFVGLIVGAAVSTPIAWVIPYPARFRAMHYLAVLHGLAAVMAASLLFWLFGVSVGVAVLIFSSLGLPSTLFLTVSRL